MHAIHCQAIHKSFGVGETCTDVVVGLDMRVATREKVAIVGVSGSGKSTLLHLIGGLEHIDSGSISVCGDHLDQMSDTQLCRWRNHKIGFIYQAHHLLPEHNALENVALPLMARGMRFAACKDQSLALLERAGLGERWHHKPHELSGGEQQRVAVCRALITSPELILADEPTGNLDSETAIQVMDLVLEINQSGSLVVATHDTKLASRLDRCVRMTNGQLSEL